MPDIIGAIMWPIKWVIELVLVAFHWLFTNIGISSDSGVAWVLSIVGLVIVVRSALIPLFVKQIKSQRAALELAPKIRALQKKYKGKNDTVSRQAMAQEQMAIYREAGTNPMASCLPMLVQMPIFFGLYTVLNEAASNRAGVGLLTQNLSADFAQARLFGAQLSISFSSAIGQDPKDWAVIILAAVLVVLMIGSQFYTSLQIMSKNISQETKDSPMFKTQRNMMYVLPFAMIFSGVAFPLGVVFYWFVSNVWTMVQQFIVIRNMPTPGSDAYIARQERLRAKGKTTDDERRAIEKAARHPESGQRNQPTGKARAKKQRQQPSGSGKAKGKNDQGKKGRP